MSPGIRAHFLCSFERGGILRMRHLRRLTGVYSRFKIIFLQFYIQCQHKIPSGHGEIKILPYQRLVVQIAVGIPVGFVFPVPYIV